MRTIVLLVLFIIYSNTVISQNEIVQSNWWTTFSGEINNRAVELSINKANNDSIVGSICNLNDHSKVILTGTESNNILSLIATVKDSVIGSFNGKLVRVDDDFFEGSYSTSSNTYPFKLIYSKGAYGTPEKRYVDFLGTDEQLETFAKDVITAFQENNKIWLSQHVLYPFNVYLSNKQVLVLNSPDEFIRSYDKIATTVLLNKMKDWSICNLWSNHNGVMLGRGEIWIWFDTDLASEQEPMFKIKNVMTY